MKLVHAALFALLAAACQPPGGGEDTDSPDDGPPAWLRVASWNVESIGQPGEGRYDAAARVIRRLDADVVAVQELDGSAEIAALESLAADLGYDHVAASPSTPFGDLQNAVISRLPPDELGWHTSPTLSGDSEANDLTRHIATLTASIQGVSVTVLSHHAKSGFSDADTFRRVVESHRAAQAATQSSPDFAWVFLAGDLNASITDPPDQPATFRSVPSGTPSSYRLGQDLSVELSGSGLQNDAFAALYDAGLSAVDMTQRDGDTATRPQSGRRIDYLFVGDAVPSDHQAEIFDCNDQELEGLPLAGEPIPESSCRLASDHLPILIEVPLP